MCCGSNCCDRGHWPVSLPNNKGRTVANLERSACWCAVRGCLVHAMYMFEVRTIVSLVCDHVVGVRWLQAWVCWCLVLG